MAKIMMNAAIPDVVSGRSSSGASPARMNIRPKTTTMNIGVNNAILISVARVHDRRVAIDTAATRSEIHGSCAPTNVGRGLSASPGRPDKARPTDALDFASLGGPDTARPTDCRRPRLKSPLYKRSVVP